MLTVYLRSLLRDEAAIDDLIQETMIVAWRRLDECDLNRPFGPWLRGMASRLVMAHYRKQKSVPVLLHETVLQVVGSAVENRVSVPDLHATILHLLGMDHHRLTFPRNGLDERLTGVYEPRIVKEIVA